MSYLCVRVAEFPVQTLLSLRTELPSQPVAVLEHEPPFELVCAINARAFRQGVRHGMTRVELEGIAGIVALRRSLPEEHSLRGALLVLLGQFTPRVQEMSSDCVCCMVLDLAGTERLSGPPSQVAKQLQQQMKTVGIEAAFCISSQVQAALTVTRTLPNGSAPVVIANGQEHAMLSSLPLSAIEPDAEQTETLTRWGIQTLGQLAALPVNDLIARMGQRGKRLHELATGTYPHLFRPLEPVFSLQAQAVFEDAIEHVDSLLFVLGPMLERLIALASVKALALLSVQLTLKLDRAEAHTLSVRPALPSTDRKFLLRILQLELAAHPPSAAVVSLELTAEPSSPAREQSGLFSPQLPDSSRLDVTLARIQSIVGDENVGSAQLKDTHAPEGFTVVRFQVRPVTSAMDQARTPIRTACRRLRPPWPVRVSQQESRPTFVACEHQRFQVRRAYGPWYSSGEWWSRDAWTREEWEVILWTESAAVPLHALLVHDLVAREWRLEGVYD